jgi:glycosyltransferase involved in cell wall biosynthesis
MRERKALFLAPEAPYPTHGGGAWRAASILEYLAQRYSVDVIVFREPGSPDPVAAFPNGVARSVHVVDLPQHWKTPVARAFRNAGRLTRGIPPLFDRFNGFGDKVANFVAGHNYEIAVTEHFWCAPYWEQIAPVSAKTVLDLHNIESVLHARCARTGNGPEAMAHSVFEKAARELESCWYPRYGCLMTASEADAALARKISPKSRVVVHANSIRLVPQPESIERNMVAFSGNLEYHPNVSAVRYFRNEIWPQLQEKFPDLNWRLIGKNPGAVKKYTSGDSRIEVSGYVQDALTELAAAKVVVVPLLAGSGTRFKIIEAWAAGRAVVSTSMGAEGLPVRDGENILLADDADNFANAVSRLLTSPDLRRRLGQAGRALFEAEFTWESTWKRLDL